jgi:hypothetical protein
MKKMLFVALFALTPACQEAQILGELTVPTAGVSIEIPVELPPFSISEKSRQFDAVGISSSATSFALQRTPALFYASDGTAMDWTYCAVLPPQSVSQKVRLDPSSQEAIFTFTDKEDGRLLLSENSKPVLAYNFGLQLAPDVPEDRRRSTYIHPIYDPLDNVITDDFPADHHHHRGLSWMWPNVFLQGEKFDLWHIQGIRHKFESWLIQEVGPVCALLGSKNSWHLDDRVVLDEWVWLRIFKACENGRAVDITLTWKAREKIEITGESQKGYGGLCFRLAPRRETVIVTSDGLASEDSDLKRADWADESGKFGPDENFSGVAIFQHTDNPDFPAGWTLRHYGFLGVAWPGRQMLTLDPQQSVTLKFRVWLHRGDADTGRVKEAFHAFEQQQKIQFKEQ